MKKLLFILGIVNFIAFQSLFAQAQTLSYGFKTGLSLSKIDGPSEMSNGMELETNDNANGFFVGALFRYWFTDLVGVKWELLYSKKGTQYAFNGPGYQNLPTAAGAQVNLIGNQRINLNITNDYIDIPVLIYGKFGKFEIEGGVSIGFLLTSAASGDLSFNGLSTAGSPIDEFNLALEYKYKKDNPGEVDFDLGTRSINVNGLPVEIPLILAAYYQFPEDRGKYFNTIDIGLNAGVYYYWNQGLFLGGRLNYGLSDVTKDDYDVSRVSLDTNGEFIPRSDKDRNVSLQFSIGFSF